MSHFSIAQLAPALRNARGRPYQHGPLALCLMKFKLSLSGRALEALAVVHNLNRTLETEGSRREA